MGMVHGLLAGAWLAVEGHEHQARDVESGHERRHDTEHPGIAADCRTRRPIRLENGVFGIVAGKQRDAAQRQRADPHRAVGPRQLAPQTTHSAHVLLAADRVNDRSGAEEQQPLEEGVAEQVENRGSVGGDGGSGEHVAELAAGRPGDDALDVVLGHPDARGEYRGGRPDDADNGNRGGCVFEHRRQAGDHKDARGDHRRRMDQGGNRGRALHRVGQPSVQRDLGRFPHRPDKQKDAGERQRVDPPAEELHFDADHARCLAEDGPEVERAEDGKDREDAEGKTEIADPVDDEGLDRSSVGRGPVTPKADQQIGHQADAFPAEEQLHEVVGGHQGQHGEGEQAQIGHEARDRGIVRHVADRIYVNHRRDDGHHEDHDTAQCIEPERPGDIDAAGDDPGCERNDPRAFAGKNVAEQENTEHR